MFENDDNSTDMRLFHSCICVAYARMNHYIHIENVLYSVAELQQPDIIDWYLNIFKPVKNAVTINVIY